MLSIYADEEIRTESGFQKRADMKQGIFKSSEYKVFIKNFPILYGFRKLILDTPRYYFSKVETGFCRSLLSYNIGKKDVYLGSLLKAFEEIPELVIEHIPEKDVNGRPIDACKCGCQYLIVGSVGNPITGSGSVDCVCPRCGNFVKHKTNGHRKRMQALNLFLAMEEASFKCIGLPLHIVIKELKERIARIGEKNNEMPVCSYEYRESEGGKIKNWDHYIWIDVWRF